MDDFNRRDRLASSGPISSSYLNFDPAILKPSTGSQFIIPEGQGEHRGKMEMAFFKIGTAIAVGGFFGGVNGYFIGRNEANSLKLTGNIRRTQILNVGLKQCATSAQAFGTLALMYSLYDTVFSLTRGVDDELNMCVAGAATGATYSISQGLKKSLRGGFLGLGVIGAFLAYQNKSSILANLNS